MKLRSLRIHRLPGIDAPFELAEVRPDVHVLVGPNASGKSSLVRALRAVTYREELRGADVSAEATFDGVGGRDGVHAVRTGDTLTWRHAGEAIDPPQLPAHEQLGCYLVRIEDLETPGATEEAIRDVLERELHGGYDLDEARTAAEAVRKPRHGQSEERELRAADAAVRAARDGHRRLADDEDVLAGLLGEWEAWRQRARELPGVQAALRLVEARTEQRQAQRSLEGFPDGMAHLHDGALADLDAALRRRAEAREAVARAVRELDRAREDRDRTGLPTDAPTAPEVAEHQAILQRLQTAQAAQERAEGDLREAEVRLRRAREALGSPRPEDASRLEPATLQSLTDALERLRTLRARAAALDERRNARTPSRGDGADAATLRAARHYASAWLRAAPRPRGWPWHLGTALMLGAAGATAFAAATATPWWAGATLALVTGLLLHHRGGASASRRHAYREAFERTGLRAPEAWTIGAVEARLDALDVEVEAAERRAHDAARREELAAERADVDQDTARLEADLRARADALGFDPTHVDASLHRWATLCADHDAALDARNRARADADAERDAAARHAAALRAFLEAYGTAPPADDGAVLARSLAALDDRVKTRDAALERERRAHGARAEAAAELEREAEAARRTFVRLALVRSEAELDEHDEVERREALRQRVASLPDYRAAVRAHSDATAKADAAEAELAGSPELLTLAEEGARDDLLDRRDASETAHERAEALHERIVRIRGELERAGSDRALERASARRRAALDALRERLDEALEAEAGSVLFDRLEAEQDASQQPAVLRAGRDAFARFTHHRYELTYDRQIGFRALDAHDGAWRTPAELSTGTLAQLLLALRVGTIAGVEAGRDALPLVLDEALTTADEARFRAVADSVRAWAEAHDRQVLYLTAREADAAFWQARAGGEVGITDVARLRADQAPELDPARLHLPERPPAPRPDGLTPEAYAQRLRVPAVDPWADPASVHLLHPLRDRLALLPPLLDAGLERCGQVRNALDAGSTLPGLDDADAREVGARVAATEAWLQAYRRGRGRPVTRADLHRCDAVTDRFLDAVADLADAVDGDATRLLDGLERGEVANFRSNKRAQLADELDANGHLDTREAASPEELVARVHDALVRELGPDPARARTARAMHEALRSAVHATTPKAEVDA